MDKTDTELEFHRKWRPPVRRATRLQEYDFFGNFDANAHEYNLGLDEEERLQP